MRIVVAACRLEDDSPPDVLYPDPDGDLLRDALLAAGCGDVVVRSWDDRGVDWSSFDAVVVRSTWDSVDRPSEYVAWARSLSGAVVNGADVLAWNLDKVYLRDLDAAGVAVVPTVWVGPGDEVPALPVGDVVVKPSVSAAGRETTWHRAGDDASVRQRVTALQAAGRTVLVQPYVEGVASVGEVKCVFLGGLFSHAVRVGALLERDAAVMERPWERPVAVEAATPTPAELALGDAVITALGDRFGSPPTYARVDLVPLEDGSSAVLEVELIDPTLFLWTADGAADRFATAILARLAVEDGVSPEPSRP